MIYNVNMAYYDIICHLHYNAMCLAYNDIKRHLRHNAIYIAYNYIDIYTIMQYKWLTVKHGTVKHV